MTKQYLSILYFNARSIIPKCDELRILCEVHKPDDVVCITESWLSSDINNTELHISGYQIVRRDRNRHGGGVLMYIREVIRVETNANNQYPNLEIVTVTLRFGSFKSCLSLCYRPPSSTVEIFNDLTGYLELVNLTQFSNYILLGDFNVDMASASSSWYDKMTELANTFCLTQVVSKITHVHHNGTATLIDQVFMSNVQLLQKCMFSRSTPWKLRPQGYSLANSMENKVKQCECYS